MPSFRKGGRICLSGCLPRVINLAAAHHDRPHGATLQNRSRGRIKPVITSGRRTKVDGPATHRPTCSGSGRRARLVDASARPYRHPDQVIERQPAQTHAMMPSRHSRPSHMFWPAVWNSQFDNKGHQKERVASRMASPRTRISRTTMNPSPRALGHE